MIELDYRDTATFYTATVDGYGQATLTDPVDVPSIYEQTTGYQHVNSQDAVVGTPRLLLPADDAFVVAHAQRLEGLIVDVNPFGGDGPRQRFKVARVTPGRDVLLGNELQHVECELNKIETESYVS